MELWQRGRGYQLTRNFHCKEFECTCGICSDQRLDVALVQKLQAVRDEVNVQLNSPTMLAHDVGLLITSGFRCARRQAQLRAAGNETASGVSTHEMGQAADITFFDARLRTPENMALLLAACEKHFLAIGVAPTWLHLDLRVGKQRRWSYTR
jgi:uncharacterized protein YcbK (DUF882 family)